MTDRPVRVTFRPASGGPPIDLTPFIVRPVEVHPSYGGPRMDAQPVKPCPCCKGEPVTAARIQLCNPCWENCVRMKECNHAPA